MNKFYCFCEMLFQIELGDDGKAAQTNGQVVNGSGGCDAQKPVQNGVTDSNGQLRQGSRERERKGGRERERGGEREGEGGRERGREGERERESYREKREGGKRDVEQR